LSATTKAITNNVAVTSYDSDYQAVLDAVTAAGDPLPTTAQQDIDNQFMIDYKATDAWLKEDCFFKFKGVGFGTGLIGYRLMDWKRLVKAVPYGGLVWSDSGVKGNGTNAYIDPLYNPKTYNGNWQLQDSSIGYKLFNIGVTGTGTIVGNSENSDAVTYVIPNNGNSSYMGMNQSVVGFTVPSYVNTEYNQVDREVGGQTTLNGSQHGSSRSATAISGNLFILARKENGGSASLFSQAGISMISFGGAKTSSYNAIKAMV
jgi:hypothetical protein